MNKKTKIKELSRYNKAAMDMAYNKGATKENVAEVAGQMRMIDIAEYIRKELKHDK